VGFSMKQLIILCLLLSAFLYSTVATANEWYCVVNLANHSSVHVNGITIDSGNWKSYPITHTGSTDGLQLSLVNWWGGNTLWTANIQVRDKDLVAARTPHVSIQGGSADSYCGPPW
jgi:hypothetical protein